MSASNVRHTPAQGVAPQTARSPADGRDAAGCTVATAATAWIDDPQQDGPRPPRLAEARSGPRFLVVSARVGAGHSGVAGELERRLTSEGAVVRVVDFLDALPARLGPTMAALYRAQLRHAPWTYDVLYRVRFCCDRAWTGINAFYTALARPALERWVDEFAPDVVVSLYPLAGMVLGRLRERFGSELDDPQARFELGLALRAAARQPADAEG